MASSSNPPNTTLYVNNLNEKVNKEELRTQLYALFTTYGKIIDIVASKGPKMRGQAFLVFNDLASATSAMRACEGMLFYDKPLRINYAKGKSYATLKKEDPTFVPPAALQAAAFLNSTFEKKRPREDLSTFDEPQAKRDKTDEDESDNDVEMEIDEDEEQSSHQKPADLVSLVCENLPQEVTNSVLSVLFEQYKGFKRTEVQQSPTTNAAGERVKIAHVYFEGTDSASAAKEALDGYTLKPGWRMSVSLQ